MKTNGFALLILLLLYAFLFQGTRGLWSGDEGRYTAASLEMLRLRSLTRLQLNDTTPHYTKPPLTYTSIAASIAAFGRSEWAVRLPNSAAFVLTVLLVHRMAVLLGLRRPRLAAAVYAGSPFPFAASNIVTTDTLLVLWHACAACAFMAAWKAQTPWRRRGWATLFWLAFGLAFLTKGPPSLMPFAALAVFAALCGGWRSAASLFWPPAVLLFLAVGLGWYVAALRAVPGLWDYWLHREIAGRALGTVKNHGAAWRDAFVLYVPVLLLGFFPWVWYLARELRGAGRFFRAEYWGRLRAGNAPFLLLLLWAAVPAAIFFVMPSRQPLYMLPSFLPLSLLAASRIELAWAGADGAAWRRRITWAAVWFCVLLAGRAAFGLAPHGDDSRVLARALRSQCPSSAGKITFVEMYSPPYGIKLYLDAQADSVLLNPAADWNRFGGPPRLLKYKLEQGESDGIFLVGVHNLKSFVRAAAACGFRAHIEGESHRTCFVRLSPAPQTGKPGR